MRATYCARLSEREKALLHNGQTYGRSWVWVRTCLSARLSASMHRRKLVSRHPIVNDWEGNLSAYLLRCSNLLKSRPHVGIGQEWDFWG
jgi:hypothetical protein